MVDRAPAHQTYATAEKRVPLGIPKLTSPPSSPNLNLIKNICNLFKFTINTRQSRAQTVKDIKQAIFQ